MLALFHTLVYQPMYNALALLVGVVPGGDVGIAIIILTLLIKFILFPLSIKAVRTQVAMREIEPELKRIRETFKDKREDLARATMALFKEKKVNPFASILLIIIQIPVILGLYYVFLVEGRGNGFDPALLCSFIRPPGGASLLFLGFLDLTGKSVILAAVVAVTQYMYARFMPPPAKKESGAAPSLQEDLMRSMHLQMRYVFPIVFGFVAYYISAAVALYFVVSNLFALAQELYVKRFRPPHGTV